MSAYRLRVAAQNWAQLAAQMPAAGTPGSGGEPGGGGTQQPECLAASALVRSSSVGAAQLPRLQLGALATGGPVYRSSSANLDQRPGTRLPRPRQQEPQPKGAAVLEAGAASPTESGLTRHSSGFRIAAVRADAAGAHGAAVQGSPFGCDPAGKSRASALYG
jgi:hypothetical protein